MIFLHISIELKQKRQHIFKKIRKEVKLLKLHHNNNLILNYTT
jgi:hypothetical protein